jgi:hypothetical protein
MTANPIRKIVDILRGKALLLEGKDQSEQAFTPGGAGKASVGQRSGLGLLP